MEGQGTELNQADWAGVLLIVIAALTALLALLRKSPFILLARLFRSAGFLVFRLLRLLRLVPKPSKAAPGTAAVSTALTPSAWAAFARPFQRQTETDQSLAGLSEKATTYLSKRRGAYFEWLQPQEGIIDLAREYDRDLAAEDFQKAKHFFTYDLPVRANPQSLYEDVNGALIVDMFKDSDRVCFYVLSEMRKTINSNVLKLSVLFSLIVSIVFIANVFYSETIDFVSMIAALPGDALPYTVTLPGAGMVFEVTAGMVNKAAFGVISCLAGMFIMWLFYQTEYSHFQRNNGRELNNFLTRYLAQLNGNFRSVEANARSSIVGDQDVTTMRENSVTWVINMQWMAFRFFFIESFLKGVIYQVLRNSSYYLLFVPLGFFITIFTIAYVIDFEQLRLLDSKAAIYQQNTFYVFFLVLFIFYFRYLKYSVAFVLESVREQEWTQFHELNVQLAMSRLIETYAGEIVFWRNRFRGTGRDE
jgi:hypothetical protein